MRLLLLSVLLTLMVPCRSQTQPITIGSDETGEGVLIRKASYDGNSLWGYINGGADLYLEYGFENVVVHEIEFRSNNIRFDLYRMSDPKAAFGIFSVYSFKCDSVRGPGEYNCATRWQLQAIKGNYYLSAILSAGTPEEYMYASGIAGKLLESVQNTPFEPGSPFRAGVFSSIPGKIKYSRGALGLENGISDMAVLLRDFSTAEVWHIDQLPEAPDYTATVITFENTDDLASFRNLPGLSGQEKLKVIPLEGERTLLLIRGSGNSSAESNITGWFTTY
jgi:hypothetical protein